MDQTMCSSDLRWVRVGLVWLCCVGVLLCTCEHVQAASDKKCLQQYRQKVFEKAGECFEALAKELGAPQELSEEQRHFKGRLLRNAAISFRRFAKGQTDTNKAGVFRERALGLLNVYLKQKLCETVARCRLTESLRSSIESEIGYTFFTVQTEASSARITIHGYLIQWEHVGTYFRKKARPGKYLITVIYPKQKPLSKTVFIKHGVPALLKFPLPPGARLSVPTPKTKPNILPWVLVGGGGLLALVGGGIAVTGLVFQLGAHSQRDQIQNPQDAKISDTEEITRKFNQGQSFSWIGGGIAIGGIAVGIAGLIWAIQQPGLPLKKTSSTTSFLLHPPSTIPMDSLLLQKRFSL